MAWHDNNWNGKICLDPVSNTYCIGKKSLKRGSAVKDVTKEILHKDQYVGEIFSPSSLPPCFWSINAFSSRQLNVIHHLNIDHSHTWTLSEVLKPYSVFTWPSKLSIVHDKEKAKTSIYHRDIDTRITNYINYFIPNESIIFFYSSFDNPVNNGAKKNYIDRHKFLLLGCSVLAELPSVQYFPINDDKLLQIRQKTTYANFTPINHALQVTHLSDKYVLLPYKEYVTHIVNHPEDKNLLEDMKVMIEEQSLENGFKYISMNIEDDKCLYLLYKIRKSILKIRKHNQNVIKSNLEEELSKINFLIEKVWKKRSQYPALKHIWNHFIFEDNIVNSLYYETLNLLDDNYTLLNFFTDLHNNHIPNKLLIYKNQLVAIRNSKLFTNHYKSLYILSLINLTKYQIDKLLDEEELLKKISTNPYSLYEEYHPDKNDMDTPEYQDEAIDIYKIDIAIMPDEKYVLRQKNLLEFVAISKERIRAMIIEFLKIYRNETSKIYFTPQYKNFSLFFRENPLTFNSEIDMDFLSMINSNIKYKNFLNEKLYIDSTGTEIQFFLKDFETIYKIVENLYRKKTKSKSCSNMEQTLFNNTFDSLMALLKEMDPSGEILNHTTLYSYLKGN